jgi:hypothetical protein
MKTGEQAQLAISKTLAAILRQLPGAGPLFPKIAEAGDNARAAEFYRRCKLLGIAGISLHSYRSTPGYCLATLRVGQIAASQRLAQGVS